MNTGHFYFGKNRTFLNWFDTSKLSLDILTERDRVIHMDIEEIRELARKFTQEQIDGCITQQIETGENICLGG